MDEPEQMDNLTVVRNPVGDDRVTPEIHLLDSPPGHTETQHMKRYLESMFRNMTVPVYFHTYLEGQHGNECGYISIWVTFMLRFMLKTSVFQFDNLNPQQFRGDMVKLYNKIRGGDPNNLGVAIELTKEQIEKIVVTLDCLYNKFLVKENDLTSTNELYDGITTFKEMLRRGDGDPTEMIDAFEEVKQKAGPSLEELMKNTSTMLAEGNRISAIKDLWADIPSQSKPSWFEGVFGNERYRYQIFQKYIDGIPEGMRNAIVNVINSPREKNPGHWYATAVINTPSRLQDRSFGGEPATN